MQITVTSNELSIIQDRNSLREPLMSFYKQCLYHLQVMIDSTGKFPRIFTSILVPV